jgi:glucose-6-phosphate isomerase
MSLDAMPEWERLLARPDRPSIESMFAADPDRATRFSFDMGDLFVDLSKHRWDDELRDDLLAVARAAGVLEARDRLFVGDRLNVSEDRPVGHLALRTPRGDAAIVDGVDVSTDVEREQERLARFVEAVGDRTVVSPAGLAFTDVVNLGIGGSDLGPAMAHRALRAHRRDRPRVHFVSNVDPAATAEVMADLDPRRTLVIVSSKTMTTVETLANLAAFERWLEPAAGSRIAEHLVAVTADVEAARRLGIPDERIFPFWEWVGGRYSLASSIGLSLALAIGNSAFAELRAGMRLVDEHVRDAAIERNVPLLAALIGILYANRDGAETKAIVPYAHDLDFFVAYVQQLDMESNGKSVDRSGVPVTTSTGPIVWGQPGTDAQHAFFQLLHQGTRLVPVDFIGFASPAAESDLVGDDDRQQRLLDNLLAQSRALAFGRSSEETARLPRAEHRGFSGDRPNTVILAPRLTPSTLGQLIAFYEWVVFFQGWIWGIDSFDQWGVELGKQMASERSRTDASTELLRERLRQPEA